MTHSLNDIQRFAVKLLSPLDLSSLYKTCIKEAVILSGAEYGSLFLYRHSHLVRVSSTVPLRHRLQPRKHGTTYQAFYQDKIRLLNLKTIQKNHPEATSDLKSIILLPLIYRKQQIGIITLQSKKPLSLSPTRKQSLKIFSSLATLSLRNMEMLEVSQLALTDRELFMSAAAHELRNPLTVITGYAQLVQRTFTKKAPIKSGWIQAMVESSTRLHNLINELLSVSQIRAGIFAYEFEPIDLIQATQSILADNQVMHQRKIEFKSNLKETEAILIADKEKLRLVFNNILGNAVKHSPSHSPITVLLSRKHEFFTIAIQDHGKGIAKKDQAMVFEKYYRGQNASKSGLGLGMYICREIITAHHGEITLSSKPNAGTKITLYLPKIAYDKIGNSSASAFPADHS